MTKAPGVTAVHRVAPGADRCSCGGPATDEHLYGDLSPAVREFTRTGRKKGTSA